MTKFAKKRKANNKNMKPLSLCVTTYNRYELTVEAIASVVEDERIDEIVILDDCSTDGSLEKLDWHFMKYEKVHCVQQPVNVGMSRNKRDAIKYATNEWAIIFDSDNVIMSDYLDALENCFDILCVNDNLIFCPDFAKPTFDYRKYGGKIITKENAKNVVSDSMGNCMLNTCNYVVNKNFYINNYRYNEAIDAADTIQHNFNHLMAGGMFYVVPGMGYFHRQHSGSGFLRDVDKNMSDANAIRKLITEIS